MLINGENLRTLGIAFNARFMNGYGTAAPMYTAVTEVVPATTKKMEYGWLKMIPRVREWVGDRVINAVEANEYTLTEQKWEDTIAVDKDDIETDNVGIYGSIAEKMGQSAGTHYDELLWPLLNSGFTNLCFDGQYFFDTDHPILDKNGNVTTFANTDGGGGTPWFLVATDALIKPIILQKRKAFELVSMTQANDENVFMRNEYVWGIDARHTGGYGLPQVAWGSKQTLDAAHFNTAISALQSMTGDGGRPLGLKKFALYVPPSLRVNAKQIVTAERDAAGATNVNYQAADPVIVPWLV